MPGSQVPAALVGILGVLGAVAGVYVFGSLVRARMAIPISAGILVGMALFVLFPATLNGSPPLLVFVSGVCGIVLFSVIERSLHRHANSAAVILNPHVLLTPLFLAASMHSIVDGWNLATIRYLPDSYSVGSLIAAMGVHKVIEGVAMGAVFRSAAGSTRQALSGSVFCEALTFAGMMLAGVAGRRLSHQWTSALLAATAGSFLYLGWHAASAAWKRDGPRATVAPALGGAVTVWILSLY